ncbi:thioredoxin domain-containing protein [Flavobacterium adhaerens]|uniref:thioredoxin domain-containing protein n=1 Tax=Flavobacterium adhaerens TaxID=3149043 RepID=UPI0032B58E6D
MRNTFLLLLLALFLSNCNQKKNKDENFEHTNDLINESSPYLLQHAHNPINWKAWNPETLAKAKAENKLIIISVGYSSCHWCHVMEKESFENDSVAKIMNDNFISIKVDREERPDIDQIYLDAVQMMTGKSGWPLNCITLPDGLPIFGGTYFTKDEWIKTLTEIAALYKKDPQKVIAYAEKLVAGIQKSDLIQLNTNKIDFKTSDVDLAIKNWREVMDFENGGFQSDSKFPMPKALHFLLRYSIQNQNQTIQKYLDKTLTKIANGGINDPIGGGFYRYTVDLKWHIPHFEKMLYDNAQLVSLFSDAYLVTKNELYKKKVTETLEFVERELMASNGAFYSSIDADSKNQAGKLEEGAYYTWTKAELQDILQSDFKLFQEYYNINTTGLWENEKYILFKTQSDAEFAQKNKLTELLVNSKLKTWKEILLKARNKRPQPHLDNKTLSSWNALMIKGYANAYRSFKNSHYKDIAIKNATFLLENQFQKDGSLHHSFKEGKSSITGFSEDYANVIDAFIAVYQITLDEKWLLKAKQLMDYSLEHFFDKKSNLFYFTSNSSNKLITRKMEIRDNVIPGSNSIFAQNLFLLGHYFSNENYSKIAQTMLHNVSEDAIKFPTEYYNWLNLFLNYTGNYYEVVVSGKNALSKINTIQAHYLPNILIAGSVNESSLPIMESRYVENKTLIYVCVEGSCKLPETDVLKAISKLQY